MKNGEDENILCATDKLIHRLLLKGYFLVLKPHCPNAFRQRGRKGKDGVDVVHHEERKPTVCNAVPPSTCSISPSSPSKMFLGSP